MRADLFGAGHSLIDVDGELRSHFPDFDNVTNQDRDAGDSHHLNESGARPCAGRTEGRVAEKLYSDLLAHVRRDGAT